ncbi:MAG: CvpA family protein [Candidatus Omnitrophica bacterium]|nr:CvpA family protein [Candidatus Omnitrophota bacterium]
MTITDTIALICCLFLVFKGASQGFLASLLGPLALILGSLVSYVYYLMTNNMIVSLCIGLFGPMVLAWTFRFILRSWNRTNNPDSQLSLISRLAGALLSMSWGMTILVITILLLTFVPPINKPLEQVSKDIHNSEIYGLIKPFDHTNKPSNNSKPVSEETRKAMAQKKMQELSKDERIQALIHDPVIAEAIKNKDYTALISNPKVTALMQDPELLKKMLSLYKDMPQAQTTSQ